MPFNLFQGLKVIDLGQGISGPFCAKLFADLGAQVIKIEPPAGDYARRLGPFPGDLADPEKSGIFLSLNTNKQGVTLNLDTATGRELLLQLASNADLLIENFPPGYLAERGLAYETLIAHNSRLVMASITPFGQTGPWANYQANNLIVCNLSGHSREHPGPVDELATHPPLQLAARQAEFVAGLCGATAAMLALNRRRLTGKGCHADVSGMEALALLPQTTLADFAMGRPPKGRHREASGRQSLLALLSCQDGYVAISPRQQDQWERFVAMLGNPEWASDPKFATRESRLDNWGELEPLLTAWTQQYRKEDVYRQAQANRIPSFPLNTAADLFHSAQFQDRGFFQEVTHPAAGKFLYPGWPIKLGSGQELKLTSAPLLGQDNQGALGVDGLGLSPQQLVTLRARGVI